MTKSHHGFLHWVMPAMLGMVALSALMSGRDLSQTFIELMSAGEPARGPVVVWAQRLVSILLVAAAAERVINHVAQHRHLPSPTLAIVFILYWVGTVAAPALFGSHPMLSHEYLYTLVIGVAALLVTSSEVDRILSAARTALFTFILAGIFLIPVMPTMVLDQSYAQGLMPGVPRFGGLAPHAVGMAMFAQVFLLLLWARPFQRNWLNVLAWVMGLAALFLAQSKTAWIAFLLCALCMALVRHGSRMWRRMSDPRNGAMGIFALLIALIAMAALLGWIVVGDVDAQWSNFADTAQGAQLISMTGRDQIWAIAIEEWRASPYFGYGLGLWEADFRAAIAMPNATSAHNQFMDTLARAGSVGAVALVVYSLVLLVMSLRYAKASGGLSLALFVALALRSISEVPMLLQGYGTELFLHLLLLVTLAAAASAHAHVQFARSPYAWGATS
ncbi:MAG: putative rane protein [Ramlibacter sp.]|jgi:O-antigen ligase|nr:putative rane protein [Ramlibacter sp.]